MIDEISRDTGIVRRLFGVDAVLVGSIGTARGPGRLVVTVDGIELGSGATLAEAIREATTAAATICRGATT